MKVMYLAKRARPDVLPAVIFLSTRVKAPTVQDWKVKKNDEFHLGDQRRSYDFELQE